MRGVIFEAFGRLPEVRSLPDPEPALHGAVIEVAATGLCRSDWHAWKGHDSGVRLPHVGGHEFAGTVVATGPQADRAWLGQRVTVPFISGCGTCPECATGNQQVCERQTQPGFTHWGSFAQYVAIDHADLNLVTLPDTLAFDTAAALGCRFGTSFRAVLRQGRLAAGEWVAVHGCGGAGLSAVMIAAAAGARVLAVDVSDQALELAREFGAAGTLNASSVRDEDGRDGGTGGVSGTGGGSSVGAAVGAAVVELTGGGAHLSLDCLGLPQTCAASVHGLRRRGRHVQVGLMPPEQGAAAVPMDRVVAYELELLGSHGIQAHEYPAMLAMAGAGTVRPERLVRRHIGLDGLPEALARMDTAGGPGVTVADPAR